MMLFHLQWLLAALSIGCLAGAIFIAGNRVRAPFRQRVLKLNILLVVGAIGLISFFNLHSYEQQYLEHSQLVEQELLEQAQELIKQRATLLQAWIADEDQQAEKQLKEQLQDVVLQAIDTATHLINTYHTTMNQQQLEKLVLDALRHNNGHNSLFALRLDGTLLLRSDHHSSADADSDQSNNDDSLFCTTEIIERYRQQGEGFIQSCIDQSSCASGSKRKISYVHYFEPLDCFFATTELCQDFTAQRQQEMFAKLDKLDKLDKDQKLTIFGASYSGISLFGPAKGENVLDVQDLNGVFVVKELIKQARQGGGFVRYSMPGSVINTSYPKLSYCLPIKDWNGYIGAGINLDNVALSIATSKRDLEATIYQQLLRSICFLPLIIVMLWYIGRRFSATIEKSMTHLSHALHTAVSDNQPIDLNKICFAEFITIGKAANEMLDQRNEAEKATRWLAHYDPLTSMVNHHYAVQCLERLRQETASDNKLWLFILRVDRLKYINNTFGHEAGDHVLRTVAQRMTQLETKPLLAARLSSSEFILVIELKKGGAEQMAITLREQIAPRISYDNFSLQTDCCIGCVPFSNDEVNELLIKANITLNLVRDNKSLDNFLVYDELLDQNVQKAQKLERDLRRAIEQPQQFVLNFQPIWDINKSCLVGFEALTRWHHPTKGIISPEVFIPLAEQKGLIVRLGEIIFEQACITMARWLSQHPRLANDTLRMSVNMAPQQFITDGFIEHTIHILERYGIPNNKLCIEITETSLMENPELAITRIRTLNELGIRISIDDFGTGYSSLSYLNQFMVNTVKIDRSLVMNIDSNKTVESISAAIINLAHDLNLHVVAEGIETVQQLDKLHQLGCDSIQGYLLGKPMPEDEAEQLIIQHALIWPEDSATHKNTID
ncbi:MAG: EAL domain-containing protein [Desulfuromonas sp.]|nr:EAL domain-containing protein [Desulfuromonas sp.]